MSERIEQELISMLPRLRRFSYGLTGNMEDADDLLQEACAKAIHSSSSWTEGSRLDSWMYRIIQNTWTDNRRRQAVRMKNAPDLERMMNMRVDEEQKLEDRMTLSTVRRAMDQLPDDQRIVLVMTCLEGVSYRQVADTLDVPVGTVMSRLSRGRKNLQQILDASEEDRDAVNVAER